MKSEASFSQDYKKSVKLCLKLASAQMMQTGATLAKDFDNIIVQIVFESNIWTVRTQIKLLPLGAV